MLGGLLIDQAVEVEILRQCGARCYEVQHIDQMNIGLGRDGTPDPAVEARLGRAGASATSPATSPKTWLRKTELSVRKPRRSRAVCTSTVDARTKSSMTAAK